MPLVSVVMPARNHGAYLAEAIDSIRGQTLRDWELVIVDDCSEDNTAAVLDRYAGDRRIRVLRNESPMGEARSRNLGIRNCSGGLYAAMDADDVAEPRRLERSANVIRQRGYAAVAGRIGYINASGAPLMGNYVVFPAAPEQIRRRLALFCCFPHSTVMGQLDLFVRQGMYDEKFVMACDWAAWQRWAWENPSYRFGVLSGRLARVRRHSGQMTAGSGGVQLVAARQTLIQRGFAYLGFDGSVEDAALLANNWRLPPVDDDPLSDLAGKLRVLERLALEVDGMDRVAALLAGYYLYHAPVTRFQRLQAGENLLRSRLGRSFPTWQVGRRLLQCFWEVAVGRSRRALPR